MPLLPLFKKRPKSLYDLDFVVGPIQVLIPYCDEDETELAELQISTYFDKQPYNLVVPACKRCLQKAIDQIMDLAAKMLANGELKVLHNQSLWKASAI